MLSAGQLVELEEECELEASGSSAGKGRRRGGPTDLDQPPWRRRRAYILPMSPMPIRPILISASFGAADMLGQALQSGRWTAVAAQRALAGYPALPCWLPARPPLRRRRRRSLARPGRPRTQNEGRSTANADSDQPPKQPVDTRLARPSPR
jgi:hypothetical protein